MNSTDSYRYWAFISYASKQTSLARTLHKRLETYRVPRDLVGRPGRDEPIPRKLFPIFRDRDELPLSSDLGSSIQDALRASRYLIVLCSRNAATSRWVNEEVRYFSLSVAMTVFSRSSLTVCQMRPTTRKLRQKSVFHQRCDLRSMRTGSLPRCVPSQLEATCVPVVMGGATRSSRQLLESRAWALTHSLGENRSADGAVNLRQDWRRRL